MTARTVTRHCPPKTVLVGVDFGDASARALASTGVVASGFDARRPRRRAATGLAAGHGDTWRPGGLELHGRGRQGSGRLRPPGAIRSCGVTLERKEHHDD